MTNIKYIHKNKTLYTVLSCSNRSPVMLQSRRRQGADSPRWPVGWPSADLGGTGIVMVMGLWNFLLLGSTVTMGLKVALFPRTALTMSSGTGWA